MSPSRAFGGAQGFCRLDDWRALESRRAGIRQGTYLSRGIDSQLFSPGWAGLAGLCWAGMPKRGGL